MLETADGLCCWDHCVVSLDVHECARMPALCMCVYACVWACMWLHICMCVCTYACVRICTCMHSCVCVCMSKRGHIYAVFTYRDEMPFATRDDLLQRGVRNALHICVALRQHVPFFLGCAVLRHVGAWTVQHTLNRVPPECMHACVCVRVCVRVYLCTYMYVYIYIYIFIYIYSSTYQKQTL